MNQLVDGCSGFTGDRVQFTATLLPGRRHPVRAAAGRVAVDSPSACSTIRSATGSAAEGLLARRAARRGPGRGAEVGGRRSVASTPGAGIACSGPMLAVRPRSVARVVAAAAADRAGGSRRAAPARARRDSRAARDRPRCRGSSSHGRRDARRPRRGAGRARRSGSRCASSSPRTRRSASSTSGAGGSRAPRPRPRCPLTVLVNPTVSLRGRRRGDLLRGMPERARLRGARARARPRSTCDGLDAARTARWRSACRDGPRASCSTRWTT